MMTNPLIYEEALYQTGHTAVGGVDEAGRGPLAGPVVACAVILPRGLIIDGVDDSKKLSPKRRAVLADTIREAALAYGIGIVDAATIDRVNILQATYMAMLQAIAALDPQPDALLIDGKQGPVLPGHLSGQCLVRGDSLSHSIAAASIIAKVTRDDMMSALHDQFPQYGFNQHKGYGTQAHIDALHQYGPCPQHRRSFKVKMLCTE